VPLVRVVSEPTRRLVIGHFVLTCLAIITGTWVTGAGPHAGDADSPRLDVAIQTVARIHGTTVMVTLALALAIAVRIRRVRQDREALTTPLSTWIFLGALQAAVGYIQYFNDIPALLVGIHIAGATAVMFAATQLILATVAPSESKGAVDVSEPADDAAYAT